MTDKKLEVKNLRISFRTAGGKVQAVRDISFDLYEGETLAIVGESGSGKSVTTRAIMGISALNAIVENGEIFYDGKDLLKCSEEDFQNLRGDKIAMIFQDPMSSLNPIVKVGKQLTEAMLLKNRTRRRSGRREFYRILKELRAAVKAGGADAAAYAQAVKKFIRAEKLGTNYESGYRLAKQNAEEACERLKELLLTFAKESETTIRTRCMRIHRYATRCSDEFLPPFRTADFTALVQKLRPASARTERDLTELLHILEEGLALPSPDFYAIGYLRAFEDKEASACDIESLNRRARESCAAFDGVFLQMTAEGAAHANAASVLKKRLALDELQQAAQQLRGEWRKEEVSSLSKRLAALVQGCIDPTEIRKESAERTFGPCVLSYCARYFEGVRKNEKERRRYEKQTARRDSLLAKGKQIDWKVTPPSLTDLEAIKGSMLSAIEALIDLYKRQTADGVTFHAETEATAIIAHLKALASQTAVRVNKAAAKRRAIRLLNEVGIPDAEKRYGQYPFELSGGQRQRIVIAIALSADPDILICDEPTTALDVTIQAQILELINKVKRERNLSVIFITHDLGVVANIADRIAVMYAGKIVEYGTAEEIFYSPAHPYTWALLSSVPDLESSERLEAIPGTPPNMIYPPEGDAFAERNRYALEIDFKRQPPMFRITDTHYAATWLLHPMAPKVEIPASVTERIQRMKKEAARDE